MARLSKKIGTLSTGTISVEISGGGQWRDIFGFAERVNPKRAFLFVSNVLGRHVPVQPHVMSRAFVSLAESIPGDLPGPIVVTGMAETAIGLGAGVHDALLRKDSRDDILYLSTTRAALEGKVMVEFSEEHSHASYQSLFYPQHAGDRKLLETARSLIMVDDEASTGKTFKNLVTPLLEKATPNIEQIHTVVLTDWSEEPLSIECSGRQITATRSSLVAGRYEWEGSNPELTPELPDQDIARTSHVSPMHREDDGRLGRSVLSASPCVSSILTLLRQRNDKSILVVGTGEHVWEPFLIAEELEDLGYKAMFCATTRSPIRMGNAIKCGLVFDDHEGLGIRNYLYNVDQTIADAIIVCADTAKDAVDPRLLKALDADLLIGNTLIPKDELVQLTNNVKPAQSVPARPVDSECPS